MSREPWKRRRRTRSASRFAARRHQPAVAEAEEVLGREEAERAGDAERAHAAAAEGGAEGLRGVLDHREVPGSSVERRRAAEEVDGQDRLRALAHQARRSAGSRLSDCRVDVAEDRRGAHARDRLGGRIEGEGRADDLVAGADAESVEHENERVGPVGHSDRVADAEVGGRLRFEGLHLGPQNEASRFEDGAEALLELAHERRVLRLDVDVRDRHGGRVYRGRP